MRRRGVIKRITAAGTATVAATGLTSGREATHVVWEIDGERAVVPIEEFDRRQDTPSVSELSTDLTEAGCCICSFYQEGCRVCENPTCI